MKRRQGIDLQKGRGSQIHVGEVEDVMRDVHALIQWECAGARCAKCEREAWLDRWDLQRGRSSFILSEVAKKLRCRACGNAVGNKVFLGRLPWE